MKEIYIGNTMIWKGGPTNLLPLTTEADGVTIYNGGLGYKVGYRVRSGGTETEFNYASFCTGFFPFQMGDVIRVYSPYGLYDTTNAVPCVNISDGNRNNIGQTAGNGKYGILGYPITEWKNCATFDQNGILTFTLPESLSSYEDTSKIAFARVTMELLNPSSDISASVSETIITVNEEIEL